MMRRVLLAALVAVTGSALPVRATDQPIDGVKLVYRQRAKTKLVFLSHDPSFLFPAIGSADDPSTAGLTVELFSSTGQGSLTAPGSAPWTSKPTPPTYDYANGLAPGGPSAIRVVKMRQGKVLKIVATAGTSPGPSFATPPQGSVGIRISTGSLRNCALFGPATIRHDRPNDFLAAKASASALSDCSDAALSAIDCGDTVFPTCGGNCPPGSVCSTQDLSTCICISGAQPCGGTSPVCNGECPSGQTCQATGGFPLPGCGCVPEGSSVCSQNACGTGCPAAQECNFFLVSTPGASGCICGAPGPCGSGGDDCPPGFVCAFGPGFGPACVPN